MTASPPPSRAKRRARPWWSRPTTSALGPGRRGDRRPAPRAAATRYVAGPVTSGNERRRHRRGDRHPHGRQAAATPRRRGRWSRSASRWSRRRSPASPAPRSTSPARRPQSKDFNDQLAQRLPLVFAFVLGLAFLLLLVTFRSIVVPIKAIVLNLLSVGAAYGVLVLVFQDGAGGVAARLPLQRRHQLLAAAVPVRDPLRPLDGLPRADPQPGPRGRRPGPEHATRRSARASRPRRAR